MMTSVWNPAVFSYILRDVIANKYVLGTEAAAWHTTYFFLQINILFKVFKIYHELRTLALIFKISRNIMYRYILYYLD